MMFFYVFGIILLAGVQSTTPANRIINGNPATIEQYPSIAQMDLLLPTLDGPIWIQSCGASIITNFHVLSAAHCFIEPETPADPSQRRIRAGSAQRNIGGIVVYIENIFNHPNFEPESLSAITGNNLDSDITVVKLLSPLVWSNVIQPIAIVQQDAVLPDNVPVVHAGWGATEHNAPSEVLLDVSVYSVNNTDCAERWHPTPVTDNMICAGDIDRRGACSQDSGGPLYFNNNNQNILVGVISFGYMLCGIPSHPTVSARVAAFTDWIIATAV